MRSFGMGGDGSGSGGGGERALIRTENSGTASRSMERRNVGGTRCAVCDLPTCRRRKPPKNPNPREGARRGMGKAAWRCGGAAVERGLQSITGQMFVTAEGRVSGAADRLCQT